MVIIKQQCKWHLL